MENLTKKIKVVPHIQYLKKEIGMTFSKGGVKELQNRIKEEGYPSNFYDWDIEQYNNNYNNFKKEYKKANNTRKRYSSRLNR